MIKGLSLTYLQIITWSRKFQIPMIELLKVYKVTYTKLRICIYSYILPCAVHPAVSSSISKTCYKNIIVQLLVKCVTAANVMCCTCILHLKCHVRDHSSKLIITQALYIRPNNYEGKSRKVNGQE